MTQFTDDDLDLETEQDKNKLAISKRENDTEKAIARRFRDIFKKDISQLVLDDKKFIKARASYLSKAEREEYADIINADYSGQTTDEPQKPSEPKLETLNREQLEAKATALGIGDPASFPNRKSLIEAIQKYQ